MKLSTIHYQYIGELHVKFYQNWWSGFRDIRVHNTEGHSFIIIRMLTSLLHNLLKTILTIIYFGGC